MAGIDTSQPMSKITLHKMLLLERRYYTKNLLRAEWWNFGKLRDKVGVFRRHAKRRRKRRKRPDFDAPPFCREARRQGQNVKGRKIDVATGFFAGALPRIRGKASEP